MTTNLFPTQVYKICNNINLTLFIPFVVLSIFMLLFATIGLSEMQKQEFDMSPIGGYQLWMMICNIYAIMIVVMISAFFISTLKKEELKKQ